VASTRPPGAQTRTSSAAAGAVDEHGDRLGHHSVEAGLRVGQGEDVRLLHADLVGEAGPGDVGPGAGQHQRGDVRGGHRGGVAAGHLDRGGGHAAPDVEHPLVGREVGEADDLLGGAPAAGVDDAFAEHGEERVRVQPRHVRARGCGRHVGPPSQ
jgi:hypothetical protein